MSDWFEASGDGSRVDVGALMDTDVPAACWDIVASGALLSMGLTSDGGALGITVTVDGRWRREYFRSAEDCLAWLAEALPAVRAAVEAKPASSGDGSRQRSRRGR